ncbi:MAG: LysR family transcriptional regulator [Alphaproteobacteria bacterium]|nr:LysR family transcriptional regulator [Alphaproteobacteria bacterium]MDE1985099.1 LysR family transcriptional regulator [Alphaproteobacteria bacterium]MDE2161744.1 LysR family transcriptional regulator [Alphaproteobacteria bacterium]MDE2265059.1 LysR family transcriptional regulator [Alphaproteobacteria bacterium]
MTTLKQLEAFYWAATSASFLIAAQRLHVSQSSLSKRISELEGQFGRQLFDRSGHKATLTEAGVILLPLARRLLNTADELHTTMADDSRASGHCRFGVGEHTSLTWLPDFVALARKTYPNLILEPSVDIGSALEQHVDHGVFDFAVIAGLSSCSAIATKPLADVRFHWAGAPSLVGKQKKLTAAMLREVAIITMPVGAGATRMADLWLTENNFEVARRLTCNSLAAIAGLVIAGVGIGLFPESWLREGQGHQALVRMTSDPPLPPLRYYLHWRRDDTRPLVARLRGMVEQVADFSKPNALWPPVKPAVKVRG